MINSSRVTRVIWLRHWVVLRRRKAAVQPCITQQWLADVFSCLVDGSEGGTSGGVDGLGLPWSAQPWLYTMLSKTENVDAAYLEKRFEHFARHFARQIGMSEWPQQQKIAKIIDQLWSTHKDRSKKCLGGLVQDIFRLEPCRFRQNLSAAFLGIGNIGKLCYHCFVPCHLRCCSLWSQVVLHRTCIT